MTEINNLKCPDEKNLSIYRIYIYEVDPETRLNSRCVSWPVTRKQLGQFSCKEELLNFIKEKINKGEK